MMAFFSFKVNYFSSFINIEVSLADIPFPSSQSVKYLGLIIDRHLTYVHPLKDKIGLRNV